MQTIDQTEESEAPRGAATLPEETTVSSGQATSARKRARQIAKLLSLQVGKGGDVAPPFPERNYTLFEQRVPRTSRRQVGRAGIDRDGAGLPCVEQNEELHPYKARGILPKLGVYQEMLRGDGTVGSMFGMISRTISKARWRVKRHPEPTEQEQEVARFVERFLGLDGTRGWLIGGLPHHLRHACLSFAYGFSPFEVTWQEQTWGGRTVLVPGGVHWRAPWSVWGWLWNRDTLAGLVQALPHDETTTPRISTLLDDYTVRDLLMGREAHLLGRETVTIPSYRLLLYSYAVDGQTEANPEGLPFCRASWVWWRVKKDVLLRYMVAHEAMAEGFTQLKEQTTSDGRRAPAASESDLDALIEMLGLTGDQLLNWIYSPAGWEIIKSYPGHDIPSPVELLDYCDHQMRLSLGAQLLGLGAKSGDGLSETFGQLLHNALDALAHQLAEDLNGRYGIEHSGLISRLVLANFELEDGFRWPTLEPVGIRHQDVKSLVDAITKSLQFLGIRYSVSVEDFLRDLLELPALTPEERALREEVARDLIVSTAGQGGQGRQSEDGTQAPVQDPQQTDTPDPEAS